ncbi:cadherin-like beta sandwich domain-containing protein, partial [Paenibacillus contaminans]
MEDRHAGPKQILVGRKLLFTLLWLFFAIAVWFGFAGAAHAASFTVTTYSDTTDIAPGNGECRDISGQCSLRAALMETNILAGEDEIVIPAGTYTLTTGQQLEIRDHVKLTGNSSNPGSTIIQASTNAVSATHRVLEINPDLNAAGYNVTIEGLTIRNGKAPAVSGYGGGGIGGDVGVSTTTISHSVISGNLASGNGYGGGIYLSGAAAGKVRMTDVTVSGNKAGEASLTGYRSRGGGVYFEGDMGLELTDVAVQSNTSYGLGGGMAIVSETASLRNVSITDSSFTGNTAISKTAGPDTEGRAGGLYLGSPAVITGTQFANNTAGGDGGGLVLDFFTGSVGLNNVTINANTAQRGGGMYINAYKAPDMTSSSIYGNTPNDVDVNPEGTDMEVTIAPAAAPGGIFSQGKTGAHYLVTVKNTGKVKSGGNVSVTVTLPTGLTATSMAGNGWTCSTGTLTCTRSDALTGESGYPVIDLTVNVAQDAPRTVTSSAKVSGGNELDIDNDTGIHETTILSRDSSLSNLLTSKGTLEPLFASGTLAYTVNVGYVVDKLAITPAVHESHATVKVKGAAVTSGQPSGLIDLTVGDNAIPVLVTAEDGITTTTYTITVNRAPKSTNANLSDLTVSGGVTLNEAFSANTLSYTANVDHEIDSLTVTPTVEYPQATVTVNGNPASDPVNLNVGDNAISVVVTAEDGTTKKTYTITVTRAKSSNADLGALALSAGTLDPVFAAGTESYTASVGNAVTSIDVTPTVADSTATVTVNNDTINSGSPKNVTLNVGTNTITVVVTAQDGTTTKTYTITVTRAKSSNADLSALTLSAGTLDPVFASGTESYTASVGNAVTSIDVTPTVADSTATVKVNNDTINSGSAKNVTLGVGTNTVTVIVTAQDGTTTKTYTITVTRAKSSNADLNALTLSAGTLDPVFASGTESYTASVGNAVTSIDVTPTVADSTATVTVNNDTINSGSPKNVTLNAGTNTVTVVVTAQDGTTKTYTITVTRAKSSNADLSALTLSDGTLDPVFAAGTESYTASVGNAITSIDVTPTVADSTATVKVNNDTITSGNAKNVTLNVGANTITVVVTAQDGTTTKTYTITVTRAKSSNAD